MDGRQIKLLILAAFATPFLFLTIAGADILLTAMAELRYIDSGLDMFFSSVHILAMMFALFISFGMSFVCLSPLRYWFTPPPEEPFDPADTYLKTRGFL